MFREKTVFVVGAGASKEFGLPVGDGLKAEIAKRLNFYFEDGLRLTRGNRTLAQAIKQMVQQSGERDANPYYAAGRRIADGMPQAISIDNFLHTHQHDDRIRLIGKIGILQSILDAEKASPIFCRENRYQRIEFGSLKETWHTTFCKMATEDVGLDAVDRIFENVGFIIFNYDRCIEHYLAQSLDNYFGIGETRSQEIVSKMDIVHPYGQVGHLPWQNSTSKIDFGAEVKQMSLVQHADQIRTFTERVEDEAMMAKMHKLIADAKVIAFLGFSYGDMNMKLLRARKITPATVYGTSLGMSEPNTAISKKDVRIVIDGSNHLKNIHLASMTCNELLNAYWKPILRGMS